MDSPSQRSDIYIRTSNCFYAYRRDARLQRLVKITRHQRIEMMMRRMRVCLYTRHLRCLQSEPDLFHTPLLRHVGSSRRLENIPSDPITVSGVNIPISKNVRDLGIYIDGALSLDVHVNNVVRLCFFHLRQLRLIRRSLTVDAAHSLVRALIHSRLDYCNSIMAGIQKHQLDRLQSVLKAAARFVLRLPSRAHVSELMRERLHWLDINHRIVYKLGVLAIQVSAQSLSNVSLGTVYLVDHRPRTSIAAILGCSDIDCSKNGNKNNWTTWFLFCRTVHMELASNELKKPRYFDHGFQKSPQNISIQSIS